MRLGRRLLINRILVREDQHQSQPPSYSSGHSLTETSAYYHDGRDAKLQSIVQEATALETEQYLRREISHLQTLVDAGTSLASRDDSAVAALQKSFNELLQEREQQVLLFLTQWSYAAVRYSIADDISSSCLTFSGASHTRVQDGCHCSSMRLSQEALTPFDGRESAWSGSLLLPG